MRTRRDWRGIAGSAGFLLIGAGVLVFSRDFSKLGAVFPRTIGWAMVLCSVASMLQGWFRPSAGPAPAAGSTPRRVLLAATMLAWAMALKEVGFLASGAGAFAILMFVASYERWTPRRLLTYLSLGAALLGGMYALFRFGLRVPLPAGALL
ncbi:MAG: hypothetical protein Fur0039_05010 [Rhodocyclaceae bacterium]